MTPPYMHSDAEMLSKRNITPYFKVIYKPDRKPVDIWRTNENFDYLHALKACKATGAPWILILEDDVLTVPKFYTKMLKGIAPIQDKEDWLYVKLFATEFENHWHFRGKK